MYLDDHFVIQKGDKYFTQSEGSVKNAVATVCFFATVTKNDFITQPKNFRLMSTIN